MSTFYNQQVFTLSIMEYGFRNGYQYSQKRAIRSAGLKLFLMLFSVIGLIMIIAMANPLEITLVFLYVHTLHFPFHEHDGKWK